MAKRKSTKTTNPTKVKSLAHTAQKRTNIPTAESENLIRRKEATPEKVKYPRRPENMILNPELNWQGKDKDNENSLIVDAAPIYVHEKIQPQAIVEDLRKLTNANNVVDGLTSQLFENFNGLSDPLARTEFYKHSQNWTNRMILGDSLQVMTSLAEKESLRGKVQCIYMDPPYGIKFSAMWQATTKSRSVKDSDESREPEMIRAFRDTWQLGINSYLSYLRDRLMVIKDLLTDSGSVFLQIGSENVHLVRCVMDEVFGRENFIAEIILRTRSTSPAKNIATLNDFIIWYAKDKENVKFTRLFVGQENNPERFSMADIDGKVFSRRRLSEKKLENARFFTSSSLESQGIERTDETFEFEGQTYTQPPRRGWRCSIEKLKQLAINNRIYASENPRGDKSIRFKYFHEDFPYEAVSNFWEEQIAEQNKIYVVQTAEKAIQRCMLMTTNPGDLVLDPTGGSGTTAFVAEKWGRRWITIDASRVSLALARARLMGGTYEYYLLKDSKEGADKEAELSKKSHNKKNFSEDLRQGFVYKRASHITLRTIIHNAEIGVIHQRHEKNLAELHEKLNVATKQQYKEWEIPAIAEEEWGETSKRLHARYIAAKQKQQKEMNNSTIANAEVEMLVDCPYKAQNTVRVTSAFTVESLSPHRILPTDAEDENLDSRPKSESENETRFWDVILENLKKAGVQNTKKDERLEFTELLPWATGKHIQFIGRYMENNKEKQAAICVGPEFGTVTRSLLTNVAREAADYFDLLIVLGYGFDAHADDKIANIGNLSVLRAHMNNDLRMADRLEANNNSNLFVSFGEPDIELYKTDDDKWEVEILGIDIFDPTTGETKPSSTNEIACWFIDTDYNEESFFVRHAYFCGAIKDDPYKKLKTVLKNDINVDAWQSLYKTRSRSFPKPESGLIAVKAINHFGDEVMKIFKVE